MERKRVLVVNGDQDVSRVVAAAIQAQGLDDFHSSTSEEGFRIAREIEPDAVLLDLQSQARQGLDFLRRIKDHPSFKDVPVFVMVNDDDVKATEMAWDLGVAGFLTGNCEIGDCLSILSLKIQPVSEVDRKEMA